MRAHSDAKGIEMKRPNKSIYTFGVYNTIFADSEVVALTESIGKPLAEVLKELGKRVPDSLVKTRVEDDGFTIKLEPTYYFRCCKEVIPSQCM
jgi:hypothetical protein